MLSVDHAQTIRENGERFVDDHAYDGVHTWWDDEGRHDTPIVELLEYRRNRDDGWSQDIKDAFYEGAMARCRELGFTR